MGPNLNLYCKHMYLEKFQTSNLLVDCLSPVMFCYLTKQNNKNIDLRFSDPFFVQGKLMSVCST